MNVNWKEIAATEMEDVVPSENFWSGINVWIERPHLLNPKLLAAEQQGVWKYLSWNHNLIELLTSGNFSQKCIGAVLEDNYNLTNEKYCESQEKCANKNYTLILRNLLPKKVEIFQDVLEAVLLDKSQMSATFYPQKSDVCESKISPGFPYRFKKLNNGIILEVLQNCSQDKNMQVCVSEKWLKDRVLSKVSKWCQNVPKQPIVPSLRLVSVKDYHSNLCYLKTKYAKKFIEIWPLYNKTDPEKYVYEDISIAAYLITLWNQERKRLNLIEKQTFVDLGCGNGFLDHILSSEGHKGIGIDIRKRKIWDVYGTETKLVEKAIEPSDKQLFPNFDWIIGNHADELTPWIPVIAARSSYNLKIFLLPCCFYTFDGKYSRKHHNLTQYQSYLNFIENLCTTMGFHVERDKLRIPSTKRACFICSSRTYKPTEEAEIEIKRNEFINSNLKETKASASSVPLSSPSIETLLDSSCYHSVTQDSINWVSSFTPRDPVELARNCTNVDKRILTNAIMIVFKYLLLTENFISVQRDSDTILWNRGGRLKIAELSLLFDSEIMGCLKKQRGGFQTLLRNHSNIFEVKDSIIQLRVPPMCKTSSIDVSAHENKPVSKKSKKLFLKKKLCYFHSNHPQGCPLSSNVCNFSHDVQEDMLSEKL